MDAEALMAFTPGSLHPQFRAAVDGGMGALCAGPPKYVGGCWRHLSASPAGELVFFLHDEVMLHVPEARAEEVSALVTEAAAAATGLLFGRIPLEFPVVAVTVDSYADAK